MRTIKIRNLTLGSGIPKICVPIIGVTKEEILLEAENIKKLPVHMVEWRADYFKDVTNFTLVFQVLVELRKTLGELPLLFTFRTAKEGGKKDFETKDYMELNEAVIGTGMIDLIDMEAFTGDAFVHSIVTEAHKNKVLVMISNHDFEQTPPKDEIISRLCQMQKLGADISKIAVMPRCPEDVLTLLWATVEMNEKYAERPIVTMSMSKLGSISRISGEYFGSAITFGSVSKASAPGQIEVKDLSGILDIIHCHL